MSLNYLDSVDALQVKEVYAPKRKQGESERQLHDQNVSHSSRVSHSGTATPTPTTSTASIPRFCPHSAISAVAFTDEKQTHCSIPTAGREHAKNLGIAIVESVHFSWITHLLRRGRYSACTTANFWEPEYLPERGAASCYF